MSTLTIVELVALCERMAAVNRHLFAALGRWVADEPDPALQRWFAVAAHRHAWHAELWSQRRPAVPIDAPAGATATGRADEPEHRAAWYAARLAALQAELAEIEAGVDPVLDPSTVRVINLVAADLTELNDLDRSPPA